MDNKEVKRAREGGSRGAREGGEAAHPDTRSSPSVGSRCSAFSRGADPNADSDTDSNVDQNADSDARSDAVSDADSDADLDADSEYNSDADSDADSESKSGADSDAYRELTRTLPRALTWTFVRALTRMRAQVLYIQMEYCEKTLADVINERRPDTRTRPHTRARLRATRFTGPGRLVVQRVLSGLRGRDEILASVSLLCPGHTTHKYADAEWPSSAGCTRPPTCVMKERDERS